MELKEVDKRVQEFNHKFVNFTFAVGIYPYFLLLIPIPFLTECLYLVLSYIYLREIGGNKHVKIFLRTAAVIVGASIFQHSSSFWWPVLSPRLGEWSDYVDWVFRYHVTFEISQEVIMRNFVMVPVLLVAGLVTATSLPFKISVLICTLWLMVLLGPGFIAVVWGFFYNAVGMLALASTHKFASRYINEFMKIKEVVWDDVIEDTLMVHFLRDKKSVRDLSDKSLDYFAKMNDKEFFDEIVTILQTNNVYWKDGVRIVQYLKEDNKVDALTAKVRLLEDCNYTFRNKLEENHD